MDPGPPRVGSGTHGRIAPKLWLNDVNLGQLHPISGKSSAGLGVSAAGPLHGPRAVLPRQDRVQGRAGGDRVSFQAPRHGQAPFPDHPPCQRAEPRRRLAARPMSAWGRKRTCLHGGHPGLDVVRHDLQGGEHGAQAPEGLLAVVQVEGVDAVELAGGIVEVPADVAFQVLAVLLVGVQARGMGLLVDGLADLPRDRAGSLQGR